LEVDLRDIYANIQYVFENSSSQGRQPKYWGIDAFTLLLVCLKFSGNWFEFASRWGFKTEAAAQKFIHRVIDLVYTPLTQQYIRPFTRDEQIDQGWLKVNSAYPEAIAIIDTKFQQTYHPKGRFGEQKVYFSKKHGAYGIKTEVTHARNGRAMSYSAHVPDQYMTTTSLVNLKGLKISENILQNPQVIRD